MSRGTRIYAVRLPNALMSEVEAQIDSRNVWSSEIPWTLSDFIRVCIVRELRKMARSRKRPVRRTRPATVKDQAGEVLTGELVAGEDQAGG